LIISRSNFAKILPSFGETGLAATFMVARGGHGMIVLHHLASSGGTVFSKALAAQGNCLLLNEIHPYFSVIPDAGFSPTTPLDQYLARYKKTLPETEIARARSESFRFQLQYLLKLAGDGNRLLLREWSHGDFFASERFSSASLPLLDFAQPTSLVALRHPVDCFLSGKTYNAWNPINSDVDEFCRRYAKFCEFFRERPGALFVQYEDFAARPDALLQEVCEKLGLAYNPDYMRQLNQFRLSGGSGRTSYEKIAPRPRRPLSDAERGGFARSGHYARACEFAGYSPELP
jgi:hypothetical protein